MHTRHELNLDDNHKALKLQLLARPHVHHKRDKFKEAPPSDYPGRLTLLILFLFKHRCCFCNSQPYLLPRHRSPMLLEMFAFPVFVVPLISRVNIFFFFSSALFFFFVCLFVRPHDVHRLQVVSCRSRLASMTTSRCSAKAERESTQTGGCRCRRTLRIKKMNRRAQWKWKVELTRRFSGGARSCLHNPHSYFFPR